MKFNKIAVFATVGALTAGGSGAAFAASGSDKDSGSGSNKECVGKGHPRGGGPEADIAKALGITAQELRTQLKSGKKLSEIATAKGKTLDDVKAAVKVTLKTRLDKAVADGKLTQTQADDRLAHVDDFVDAIESGKKPPRPPGGKGGPGGPPPA
jgi:hypothetical protein